MPSVAAVRKHRRGPTSARKVFAHLLRLFAGKLFLRIRCVRLRRSGWVDVNQQLLARQNEFIFHRLFRGCQVSVNRDNFRPEWVEEKPRRFYIGAVSIAWSADSAESKQPEKMRLSGIRTRTSWTPKNRFIASPALPGLPS